MREKSKDAERTQRDTEQRKSRTTKRRRRWYGRARGGADGWGEEEQGEVAGGNKCGRVEGAVGEGLMHRVGGRCSEGATPTA